MLYMWVRMRQFCSLLTVPKYKYQRLVIDEVQNVVYTICKYGGLMLTGVPISGDLASADKKQQHRQLFFRSGQESIDTTRPLSIVSLNIKNVKSKTLCLTSLLEDYDFITLQEHWLFKFEQHMFLHLTSYPDVDYVARSCDETNPIPPAQPPRG